MLSYGQGPGDSDRFGRFRTWRDVDSQSEATFSREKKATKLRLYGKEERRPFEAHFASSE